jgi:hypothetical protein
MTYVKGREPHALGTLSATDLSPDPTAAPASEPTPGPGN